MIEQPLCDVCSDPVGDMSYACRRCGQRVERSLGDVVKVAGEAVTTIARQAHIGGGGKRTSTEPPLPYSVDAAWDHDAAVNTLITWARHVHESSGRPMPTVRTAPCSHSSCDARRSGWVWGPTCAGEPPEHPLAVVATYLIAQLEWLRHRQEAAEAFDEITDACRVLTKVVDRPAERWYAGGCDVCAADLYPVAGAKTARCSECSCVHELEARMPWLLDQAENVLAGASWCAATLTRLGAPTTASTIRSWGRRGRLVDHGHDPAGHPLYRLGSVRELVLEAAQRERMRKLQAAVDQAERQNRRAAAASLTPTDDVATLTVQIGQPCS